MISSIQLIARKWKWLVGLGLLTMLVALCVALLTGVHSGSLMGLSLFKTTRDVPVHECTTINGIPMCTCCTNDTVSNGPFKYWWDCSESCESRPLSAGNNPLINVTFRGEINGRKDDYMVPNNFCQFPGDGEVPYVCTIF